MLYTKLQNFWKMNLNAVKIKKIKVDEKEKEGKAPWKFLGKCMLCSSISVDMKAYRQQLKLNSVRVFRTEFFKFSKTAIFVNNVFYLVVNNFEWYLWKENMRFKNRGTTRSYSCGSRISLFFSGAIRKSWYNLFSKQISA